MSTVWFIRHGESISNANLPTTHPAESELTPTGETQAQQIVQAFSRKPDLIVVSPFVRARQTAVPTIEHFHPVAVTEWPIYEFTYLHPERYAGTTGEQRTPSAMAYWQRNNPFEKEEGEGESFAELLQRVQQMVQLIRKETADFIAIFGHGLFLRAFLWMQLTGIHEASADAMRRYAFFVRSVAMPNGSILKTHIDEVPILLQAGFDISHLHANEA